MKIVANTKLIERNHKFGRYLTIGSIVVIVAGVYIVFTYPEQLLLSYGLLLVGFIVTQVSIYYGSRWGRSPRPDELLTAALKGLDDKYTLYHYASPVSHLLLGPAGMWALLPYNQAGSVRYNPNRKRFTQQGGNAILKVFGQEGLGRPELDAQDAIKRLQKLADELPENLPRLEPEALLVFTQDKVKVEAQDSPITALQAEKVKDFFRKQAKEGGVPMDSIVVLQKSLMQ